MVNHGSIKKPNVFDQLILDAKTAGLTRASRRTFMQRALATGASLAVASVVWDNQVKAATPATGGSMRIGMNTATTNDGFDPATMNTNYHTVTMFTCRNYLVEIDENNEAIPELAESWEGSQGATVWHMNIRKGVEFHNGKSLTAEDIIATMNYHRGPNSKSSAKPLFATVDDVKADGSHAIVVTMKSGNADFPFTMSNWNLGILPSDGKGGVETANGIGTGGYAVESHNPGVETVFKRNKNYWKPNRAHFDSVTLVALNDSAARSNSLITGGVDAIMAVENKTAHFLKSTPGIQVDDVTSSESMTMPMHADVAPFDNNDVRMALKLAINRQEVRDKIFFGHASIANDYPISPIMPYWNDIPQRAYDPDKAKFHLKKAGAEGLSIKLSASDAVYPGTVDMGVLYAEQAKAAGINIEVVREPSDGYWSDVWLKKSFCFSNWLGRPTPDAIYSIAYAADAPWNESHFQNARFNELLVQARGELDQKKRAAQYAEMAQIFYDQGSSIIPVFVNQVFARRDYIQHGEKLTGDITLDGGRAAERWWRVS